MKRAISLFWFIVIAVLIGFAACDGDSNKNNGGNDDDDPIIPEIKSTIIISGTLKVPATPAVTNFILQAHNNNWEWSKYTEFNKEAGDTISWSIEVPKFTKSTDISFEIKGYANNQGIDPEYVVGVPGVTKTVFDKDLGGIILDISNMEFITLSGSINILKGTSAPPPKSFRYVIVTIFDSITGITYGERLLQNVFTANESHDFSVNVPKQTTEREISFHIYYQAIGEFWDENIKFIFDIAKDTDGKIFPKFKDQPVSGYKVPFDLRVAEDKPFKDRWSTWTDSDSTATAKIDFPNNDNECEITIEGQADTEQWKAKANYTYSATAGKAYKYSFKARTESGTRYMNVEYYTNSVTEVYKYKWINIDTTEKTFVIYGEPMPSGGIVQLSFQSANVIGQYYISDIQIKEINNIEDMTPVWNLRDFISSKSLSGSINDLPMPLERVEEDTVYNIIDGGIRISNRKEHWDCFNIIIDDRIGALNLSLADKIYIVNVIGKGIGTIPQNCKIALGMNEQPFDDELDCIIGNKGILMNESFDASFLIPEDWFTRGQTGFRIQTWDPTESKFDLQIDNIIIYDSGNW